MPRVLLTSVFKPFGVDGLYSRRDSKIELFHNQVTKYQGCFSIRTHFDTFGLHAIANNIEAPTVVLDFPSRSRFRKEIAKGYDYVGIGSIICNFQKVKAMVEDIHRISPNSKVVIGGFCSTIPKIKEILNVDYVCVGEGISFMRELLGEPPEFTFRQPDVVSRTKQVLGVPVFWGDYHPYIIVGLGCSYGCDFCSPSHFFGRRHIRFLKTGEEIFNEMLRLGKKYHSNVFTMIGDDNFLLDKKRARELHDLIVKSGNQYNIFIFASADLVSEWEPAELAEMGICNIWIGRESKFAPYRKNSTVNLKELITELRKHGIKVILSSILLLDCHTKENVWEDINDHIEARPVFSQFSFYSPAPGTPLWDRMMEENRLIAGIPYEEMHAFKQPWFFHPEFTLEEAEKLQESAYLKEYHELGPGIVRFIEADFEGYMNMKDSPRQTLRARAKFLASQVSRYRAILLASEKLVPSQDMSERIRELRKRIEAEFGKTTAFEQAEALGLYLFGKKQDLKMKYFGDAIQPKTRVTKYRC